MIAGISFYYIKKEIIKVEKAPLTWSLKQFNSMDKKGRFSFDHPIQREGDQWNHLQKSLLVHTLANDQPLPALYSVKEDNVYYILDGQQRLTSIFNYLSPEDGFSCHEDTPPAIIDGEEYELANKKFHELDPVVQQKINDFSILMYKMDETTDEEIEFLFLKLNNGVGMSDTQKARPVMGIKWAERIIEVKKHPLLEKAPYTERQLKQADNETALLQTMLLLDKNAFGWDSISAKEIFQYTHSFKKDTENKEKILATVVDAMDYLNKVFKKREAVMLKKINFPMTVMTAIKAKELGIIEEDFEAWTIEFKKALKGKSIFTTDYKSYGGAGGVKKDKTFGRIEEMEEHLLKFFGKSVEELPSSENEVAVTQEV